MVFEIARLPDGYAFVKAFATPEYDAIADQLETAVFAKRPAEDARGENGLSGRAVCVKPDHDPFSQRFVHLRGLMHGFLIFVVGHGCSVGDWVQTASMNHQACMDAIIRISGS